MPEAILFGLVDALALFEPEELVFAGLLIKDFIIAEVHFDSGALHGADPFEVVLIVVAFGLLFDNVDFPEGEFFRVEVEVLLVLIDRVEEVLFSDHAVELAFGVAEQLNLIAK